MNHSKKIKIPGIGDILLEKSRRAKHLNLSLRPFKGARVAVPSGVSFECAADFAQSKADWIKARLSLMAHMEQRAAILRNVVPFDSKQAKRQLIQRLEELALEHGYSYRRVFIRNQKTRWGSCSQDNNINLNINLVLLPSELMDYTILHELVHTRVKNHGPQFWKELTRCVPEARSLDRKIDQYRALLATDL